MDFDAASAFERLIEMSADHIDSLEFGVVSMDGELRVGHYDAVEARMSGLDPSRVVGKKFFVEVAPCCNNFMVAQRFVDEEKLDATLDYVFTFGMQPHARAAALAALRGQG